MMNDTERLTFFESWWASLPHAVLQYNDDPEIEDDDGALIPVGFSVYVSGCTDIVIVSPTLRGLIDKIWSGGSHS